jgi:hypothetical protein
MIRSKLYTSFNMQKRFRENLILLIVVSLVSLCAILVS